MVRRVFDVLAINGAMVGDDGGQHDDAMMSAADITKSVAITDSSEFEKIRIYAGADVPTNVSAGALGYRVISSTCLEAIIVTTTHVGVRDSMAQVDANDASFHNHCVALREVTDDAKCPGLEVRDISFQQPGDVIVSGNAVVIEDASYYFGATHNLSGDHISFNADSGAGNAVYNQPVDGGGNTSRTHRPCASTTKVQLPLIT